MRQIKRALQAGVVCRIAFDAGVVEDGALVGCVFIADRDVARLVGEQGRRVVPAGGVTGDEELAAFKARGAVFAEFGRPLPAARHGAAACDDVDDVAGEAGDVEAGAVDDLDPDDAVGGDAREGVGRAGGFGRDALGVDQDVGAALAEAALRRAFRDGEAGRLLHHIEGGTGRVAIVEFGRVDSLGDVRAGAGEVGRGLGRGLGLGGSSEQAGGKEGRAERWRDGSNSCHCTIPNYATQQTPGPTELSASSQVSLPC